MSKELHEDVYDHEGSLESLESAEEEHIPCSDSSYWSYRVVINNTVGGVEAQIYEVYFDGNGHPEGWIEGRSAYGYDEESVDKTVSELRDDLEMMLEAFNNETYQIMMDGEEAYLEAIE